MDDSSGGYSTVDFNINEPNQTSINSNAPQDGNMEQYNCENEHFIRNPIQVGEQCMPAANDSSSFCRGSDSTPSESFPFTMDHTVMTADNIAFENNPIARNGVSFSNPGYSSCLDISSSSTNDTSNINSTNTIFPTNEMLCDGFASSTSNTKIEMQHTEKYQFHGGEPFESECSPSTSHQQCHENSESCNNDYQEEQSTLIAPSAGLESEDTMHNEVSGTVFESKESGDVANSELQLYQNEAQSDSASSFQDISPFLCEISDNYSGPSMKSEEIESVESSSMDSKNKNIVNEFTDKTLLKASEENRMYEVSTTCVTEDNRYSYSLSAQEVEALGGGEGVKPNDGCVITDDRETRRRDFEAFTEADNATSHGNEVVEHNSEDLGLDSNDDTNTAEVNLRAISGDDMNDTEGGKEDCVETAESVSGSSTRNEPTSEKAGNDTTNRDSASVTKVQTSDEASSMTDNDGKSGQGLISNVQEEMNNGINSGTLTLNSSKNGAQEQAEVENHKTNEVSCLDVTLKQETDETCEADASTSQENRPVSPMVASMNFCFFENQEASTSNEPSSGHSKSLVSKPASECVRITRARTGTLPARPSRLVDQMAEDQSVDSDNSDSHSVPDEDWEYAEGAESAPSIVDPSISAPDCVLRVVPEEMNFYESMFCSGIDAVLKMRLHCTICGRHIGAAPNYLHLGNQHKVLRVLICNRCRAFYGKGKFPRDSDGSELYCRWCGQGGQVICCSHCPNVFCKGCLKRNFGSSQVKLIEESNDWSCLVCNYRELWQLRGICWALLKYTMQKKSEALMTDDVKKLMDLEKDESKCCGHKNHRKRKASSKSKASVLKTGFTNSTPSHQSSNDDFTSGHFLLGDFNNEDGDMDFDPLQFVQPVLEEPGPVSEVNTISTGPEIVNVRSIQQSPPRLVAQRSVALRRIAPGPVQMPMSKPRIFLDQSRPRPQLYIRQGGLVQPGLVPIRVRQNSIQVRPRPPSAVVDSSRSVVNPAACITTLSNIQTVDGVRSYDQVRSLSSVGWFRDGLDSMRAVSVALTKRLRELEARFHSLKNKDDCEKVIILGKKLDRLGRKTQQQYLRINAELKQGCRSWLAESYQKRGKIVRFPAHSDPFEYFTEPPSDWDDDAELSRPLEKVLIPVSTPAPQGSNTLRPRLISSFNAQRTQPPPLVSRPGIVRFQHPSQRPRHFIVQKNTVFRQRLDQNSVRQNYPVLRQVPPPSLVRPRMITSTLLNPSLSQSRSPGSNLMKLLNNASIVDSVGNSVSITVSSPKRKREDSDSDVEIYKPTISELIIMHNVKPCSVRIEKCDTLIESLCHQQAAKHSECNTGDGNDERNEETAVMDNREAGNSETMNEISDDDDDIQFIEEVNCSEVKSIPKNESDASPSEMNDSVVYSPQRNDPSDVPNDLNEALAHSPSRNDSSTEFNTLKDAPNDPLEVTEPIGASGKSNEVLVTSPERDDELCDLSEASANSPKMDKLGTLPCEWSEAPLDSENVNMHCESDGAELDFPEIPSALLDEIDETLV